MNYLSKSIGSQHFEIAAMQQGLTVKKSGKAIIITNGKRKLRIYNSVIGTPPSFTKIFNRKGASKLLMKALGANVLDGYLFMEKQKADALRYGELVGWPVVVKPDNENKGKGVYVNINNIDELSHYFDIVAGTYGSVFVEKQSPFTKEYRFYCVQGKVLAVNHREPANVVGDGESSIKELVEKKNKERRSRGIEKYPLIVLDNEAERVLEAQGVNASTILKMGEGAYLRLTSNISTGGDSISVMDEIHPSYLSEIEGITKKLSDVFVIGFDVFIDNVKLAADSDNWYICEVNRQPAIRMHVFPWRGAPINIGGFVLDAFFNSRGDV